MTRYFYHNYPRNAAERGVADLWVGYYLDLTSGNCGLCQGTHSLTLQPSGEQTWCICPNAQSKRLCEQLNGETEAPT